MRASAITPTYSLDLRLVIATLLQSDVSDRVVNVKQTDFVPERPRKIISTLLRHMRAYIGKFAFYRACIAI